MEFDPPRSKDAGLPTLPSFFYAVERAKAIVLARNYLPQKIDFIESMKFVRQRVLAGQQPLTLPES